MVNVGHHLVCSSSWAVFLSLRLPILFFLSHFRSWLWLWYYQIVDLALPYNERKPIRTNTWTSNRTTSWKENPCTRCELSVCLLLKWYLIFIYSNEPIWYFIIVLTVNCTLLNLEIDYAKILKIIDKNG